MQFDQLTSCLSAMSFDNRAVAPGDDGCKQIGVGMPVDVGKAGEPGRL